MRKRFLEEYKENLENFYNDKKIIEKYPMIVKVCRALLLFIPSSAFNESVNSTLGAVRNQHRKSLLFETTKATVVTKYNLDLV